MNAYERAACVIPFLETGIVGDYRRGRTHKRAILAWESAPRETARRHAGYSDV
jgi:hypothetical protein